MSKRWFANLLFLSLIFSTFTVNAATDFPRASVPDPLKSWIPWVLDGVPDIACPQLFNDGENRTCAWPGVLELKANEHGAEFSQSWQVHATTWISLPGDEVHWPQDVLVDGKALPVINHDNGPAIQLTAGAYRLTGRFFWKQVPESLALADNSGLLRLDLMGKLIANPVRDAENRLWLQKKIDSNNVEQTQLKVFRKVIDGVPVMLETRFHLEVSGKGRELNLGRALLPELVAQALHSPLPANLSPDGNLLVQARAGSWDITLLARHPSMVKSLSLPSGSGLLADEEIWVFQAAPLVRTTSVEGPTAIDTQQTSLPAEWRGLPAYLMRSNAPNQSFGLKEIRRGDSDPAPDRLTLKRRLWLSFDGKSMTMNDQIDGEVNRGERLNMGAVAQLGRIALNGDDQAITSASDKLSGIEIKRGKLNMSADSVIANAPHRMPALAWLHDFDHVGIELILPAGWRLLYANGVDQAQGAWLSQWNLLDFFLVLVIALAAGHLWGRKWGVIALLALVLSYQEINAPRYLWLLCFALIALMRALPSNRFQHWVAYAQKLSLLALVLVSLGFATMQVRGALYPVLENETGLAFEYGVNRHLPSPPLRDPLEPAVYEMAAPPQPPAEVQIAAPEVQANAPSREFSVGSGRAKMSSIMPMRAPEPPISNAHEYDYVDPDAKVQTGPGLPQWQWRTHHLLFDGPVGQDQQLDLWLLPPWANKIVVLLRLLLLGLLLKCVLGFAAPKSGGGNGGFSWRTLFSFGTAKTTSALLVLIFGAASLTPLTSAMAQNPTPEHLTELKEKLLRPAECLPTCAEISRLNVQVNGSSVQLLLDIDASINTALPLPGGAKHWLPNEARLDGKLAYVHRDDNGALWMLAPAGRHRMELIGELMLSDTLFLPLPLKPRMVEVHADAWDVAGLADDTGAADTLQLSRRVKSSGDAKKGETQNLPPFLRVSRVLYLDKEWTVQTTVTRASPVGVPALAQVPLLDGEAVTSAGTIVKNAQVLVNLGPQTENVSWSSTLKQSANLSLSANKTSDWVEDWTIISGAMWHVTTSGIPAIAVDGQNAAQDLGLKFQAWPGETLKLAITRPSAVAGQTLTIDQSHLSISPGARASDYRLIFSLRSSRGGDHNVTLPEGAVLQKISVNQQQRPIRPTGVGGRTLRIPIVPGKQDIEIVYRLGAGIDTGMAISYSTATVNLGATSVNSSVAVQMPHERWLLLVSGAGLGPAILFWGKLIILLVVGFAISRSRFDAIPLRTSHWLLLSLGLTQVSWAMAAMVIGWFFVFCYRAKSAQNLSKAWIANLRQLCLAAYTIAFFVALFDIVHGGLLGQPEMQVAGNNSNYANLNWYLDRIGLEVQSVWVLSLPILVYRGLMLLWALWLAWSLIGWLKWAWSAFSQGGLWQRKAVIEIVQSPAVSDAENAEAQTVSEN